MSGVIIDVTTRSGTTEQTLQSIDKNLGNIDKNASNASGALQRLVQQSKMGTLKSDTAGAATAMRDLGAKGSAAVSGIAAPAASAASSVKGLAAAAAALVASLAAMQGVSTFYKISDELTDIQNKLRLVTKSTEDLIRSQKDLFILSQQTRSGFKETADVYFTLARSMQELGESRSSLLSMTKTIQQAIAVSGTSTESAKAALLQFSQGLASGTLRGEELNSVMEQMPRLGQALTKGLNMNVGELRKFAEQGKLTTAVVTSVLKDSAKLIDEEFQKTSGKAADGFNKVVKSIKLFVGEANAMLGSSNNFYKNTSKISEAIDSFSDNMQSNLYVITQGMRNYIGNLNVYSASLLAFRKLNEGGIGLFDVVSAYQDFSQAKKMLTDLGILKKKVQETDVNAVKDEAIANRPTGFADMFASDNKEASTLAETVKGIGSLILSAGYAFTGIFVKLPKLIPDIRGPVATATNEIDNFSKETTSSLKLLAREALLPFARNIEAVFETLNLFQEGDNALERSWVRVFKSTSLSGLTENLRDLGDELRNLRFSEQSTIFGDIIVFAERTQTSLYDVLRYFDLIDNRLVHIGSIRTDRLIQGFQTLASILERLYSDVLYVPLAKAFNAVYFKIELFGRAVGDAIKDKFTKSAGEDAAESLVSFIKGVFSANTWKSIFDGDSLADGIKSGLSGAADKIKAVVKEIAQVLLAVINFIVGFVSTLFREMSDSAKSSFEGMVSSVNSASKGLLSGALRTVQVFTDKVKYAFWSAYDAVVGHSYWPDLVDGVIDHTHRLSESLFGVQSFGDKVKDTFKNMAKSVADGLRTISGGAIDIKVNLNSDTFSQLGSDARKYISAAIIAAIAFALGGPKTKLFMLDTIRSVLSASLIASSSDLSSFLGQSLGEGLAVLSNLMVSTVESSLNNIINGLPSFSEAFMSGLTGPIATSLNAFASLFPSSGIMNAIVWGSIGYAAFTKKGLDVVKSFYAGVGTAAAGLIGKDANSKGMLSDIIIGKDNGKFIAVAIAAILASALDSISLMDSAVVAAPLLLVGLLGGDVTGKILKDLIFTRVSSAISGGFSGAVNSRKSQIAETGKTLVAGFVGAIVNAQRNSKSYMEGAIDLASLFELNADGSKNGLVDKLKDFGNVLKTSMTNLKDSIVKSKVAASLSDMFSAMGTAVSVFMDGPSGLKSKLSKTVSAIAEFGRDVINPGTYRAMWGIVARETQAKTEGIAAFMESKLGKTGRTLAESMSFPLAMVQDHLQAVKIVFEEFKALIVKGASRISVALTAMAAAGGPTGFVGKMLLGVSGKAFLVAVTAAVLFLFSASAQAANSANDAFTSLGSKTLDIVQNLAMIAAGLYTVWKGFELYKLYKASGIGAVKLELVAMLNSVKDTIKYFAAAAGDAFVRMAKTVRSALATLTLVEFWQNLHGKAQDAKIALFAVGNSFVNMGSSVKGGIAAAGTAMTSFGTWLRALSVHGVIAAWQLSAALIGWGATAMIALGKVGIFLKAVGAGFVALFTTTTGLIASGVALAGGVLGLYFFGPEGSFLEKLEWAKDKLMELSGISKKSVLAPRQSKIQSLLPDESFAGIDVSFKSQISQMDGEKMTPYQFRMMEELSSTTGDTVQRMKDLYAKQGELTDAQRQEVMESIKQQERMFARMPKNDNAPDFVKASNALSESLLAVDTSFSSAVRNVARALLETTAWMFGDITSFVSKIVSNTFKAMSGTITSSATLLSSSFNFASEKISETGNYLAKVSSKVWEGIFGKAEAPVAKKFSPNDDFTTKLGKGLDIVLSGMQDGVDSLKASIAEYGRTFNDIAYPPASRDRVDMAAKVNANAVAINDAKKYLVEPEIAELVQYTSAFERAQKMLDSARASLMFTESSDQIKKMSETLELARANYERAVANALDTAELRKQGAEYRSWVEGFWISTKDTLGIQSEDSSLGLELLLSGGEEMQFAQLSADVKSVMQRLKDGPMSVGLSLPLKLEVVNARRVAKEAQERINAFAFVDTKLEYQLKMSGVETTKDQLYDFYATNKAGYEEWSSNLEKLEKKLSDIKGLTDKDKGDTETADVRSKLVSLRAEAAELQQKLITGGPKAEWIEVLKKDMEALGLSLPDFGKFSVESQDALVALATRIREAANLKKDMEKNRELKLPNQVISDFQALGVVLKDINLELDKIVKPRPTSGFGEWAQYLKEKMGMGFDAKDVENLTPSQIRDRQDIGIYKSQVQPKYDAALASGDLKGMQDYARQLYELDQLNLQIVPKYYTLNDVIGRTGLTFERFFKAPRDSAKELLDISKKLADLDLLQSKQQFGKVSGDYVKKLSEERNALEARKATVLASAPDRSPAELTSAFSSVGLQIDDYKRSRMDGALLSEFLKHEREMANTLFSLNSKDTKDPAKILKLFSEYQEGLTKSAELNLKLQTYSEANNAIQTAFPKLELTDEFRGQLTNELINEFVKMANKRLANEAVANNMNPADGAAARKLFMKGFEEDSKRLIEDAISGLRPQDRMQMKFAKFAPQDPRAFNYVSGVQEGELSKLREGINATEAALKKTMSSEMRAAAITSILEAEEALREGIANYTISRKDTVAYQAGKSFADNLHQSVNGGIKDVLNGRKSPAETLKGIITSFAENVVNTFVDAMTKPITGEKGWLNTTFTKLFEGFYDYFNKSAGGKDVSRPVIGDAKSGYDLTKAIAPEITSMTDKVKSWFMPTTSGDKEQIGVLQNGFNSMVSSFRESFPRMAEMINSGLGETFLKGIGGLLGSLDGVFRSIFSVFNSMGTGSAGGVNWLGIALQVAGAVAGYSGGTASAGAASGAGSGANLPDMGGGQGLMAPSGAISSGASISSSSVSSQDWLKGVKFAGNYAIGGIVPGPLASPQAVMAHGGEVILNNQQQKALLNGGAGGNTQNITLNIQGDVSRQTRSEILKMMPQIALGVNSQNREAGTR